MSGSPSNTFDARRLSRWLFVLAPALAFLVYLRTLAFPYVYDDISQILQNDILRGPVGIGRIFFENLWRHASESGGVYYRPVFSAWLVLNHKLFGFQPAGWHATTLLVHVLVTVLVWNVIVAISGDRLIAGIAAVIFAIHPIHIESVAWISGVSDPLLSIFVLSSFLCFLSRGNAFRHSAAAGPALTVCALAFYLAALLTKETAVMFPAVIFFYVLLTAGSGYAGIRGLINRSGKALVEALPFAALAILYLFFRTEVLGVVVRESAPFYTSTLIFTIPKTVAFYFWHLIWPFGLSAFYDGTYVTSFSFTRVAFPLLFVLAVLGGLWVAYRYDPVGRFSAVWIVLWLAPAIALFGLPYGDFLHDRYNYIPSLGYAYIVASLLRYGIRRLDSGDGTPVKSMSVLLLLILVFTLGTVTQSAQWRSNYELYQRGVSTTTTNTIARSNLATELMGRNELERAERLYKDVIAMQPASWTALYSLGQLKLRTGEFPESKRYLSRAIRLWPDPPEQYLYLGFALMSLGEDGASEDAFRQAIRRSEDKPGYHHALGVFLLSRGRLRAAQQVFLQELEVNPESPETRARLTEVRRRLGS